MKNEEEGNTGLKVVKFMWKMFCRQEKYECSCEGKLVTLVISRGRERERRDREKEKEKGRESRNKQERCRETIL